MRTGRPAFHIKARWITVDNELGSHFYLLDEKSRLVLINGQVIAHKYVPNPHPPTTVTNAQAQAQVVSRPGSVATADIWFDNENPFALFDDTLGGSLFREF
jgi:hypothetical protein